MNYLISLIAGYLLGSINASIIISKIKGIDIRKHGSGNAGATNTLRTLGKKAAVLVTLFDIFKGVAAVLLSRLIFKDDISEILAASGAVLGHNFPVFFGFKGGKGILTSFAVALVLEPFVALIALAVGVAVIAATKFVSLGSIAGAVILPVAAAILCRNDDNMWTLAFMTAIAILAIVRHHANIERLISGTESKISFNFKKKDEQTQ